MDNNSTKKEQVKCPSRLCLGNGKSALSYTDLTYPLSMNSILTQHKESQGLLYPGKMVN